MIADGVSNFNRLDVLDGAAVLVTFTIAWSAGAAGVQEVSGVPLSENAIAAGDADGAVAYKDDDTPDERLTGLTVGTGAEDVTIDNVSIANGQTVNLTGFSLTMPAAV
jgi:hypothetical protein